MPRQIRVDRYAGAGHVHQDVAHRRHDENMLTQRRQKVQDDGHATLTLRSFLDMSRADLVPQVRRMLRTRTTVKDTDGERHMECSEWLEHVGAVLT